MKTKRDYRQLYLTRNLNAKEQKQVDEHGPIMTSIVDMYKEWFPVSEERKHYLILDNTWIPGTLQVESILSQSVPTLKQAIKWCRTQGLKSERAARWILRGRFNEKDFNLTLGSDFYVIVLPPFNVVYRVKSSF